MPWGITQVHPPKRPHEDHLLSADKRRLARGSAPDAQTRRRCKPRASHAAQARPVILAAGQSYSRPRSNHGQMIFIPTLARRQTAPEQAFSNSYANFEPSAPCTFIPPPLTQPAGPGRFLRSMTPSELQLQNVTKPTADLTLSECLTPIRRMSSQPAKTDAVRLEHLFGRVSTTRQLTRNPYCGMWRRRDHR
jgi:hypothetical protein